MKLFLLVIVAFLCLGVAAQDSIPAHMAADSIPASNPVPEEVATEQPEASGQTVRFPMSPSAFKLSLCVLGFGLLILLGEIVLVWKLGISPQDTIKFIVVTIIVIGSLYLITAGYTNDQIAPAMGLLGTIAGYLLGKMGPESASNNKPDTQG